MFWTERESARPAMLSTATSEAVGMPSAPATMMMASAQRAICTVVLMKPCRMPSSFFERERSLSMAFIMIRIAMTQTIKTRIAETRTFAPERPSAVRI